MANDHDREAQRRLIVALDVPNVERAEQLIAEIDLPYVIYKIGLELLFAGGIRLAARLAAEGRSVFVDAKFLDIPNTVERATAQVADLGASFLTIHAHDEKTIAAAVRGKGQSRLQLLGVTLLTSSDEADLLAQGLGMTASQVVMHRTSIAAKGGCDGVIASPVETGQIRSLFGDALRIVTPGIRPHSTSGLGQDDQVRTATPEAAIAAGADFIVVGRPIVQADDPALAARAIVADIARALKAQKRPSSNVF